MEAYCKSSCSNTSAGFFHAPSLQQEQGACGPVSVAILFQLQRSQIQTSKTMCLNCVQTLMRFCNSSQLVESSKGGVDSNPKLTVTMDLPESAHWKYRTAARQLYCDFYSFLDCSRCSPFYALFDQNFLVEYKSARPWTRSFDAIYSPRSSPASNMLTHWAMWAIGWTKTFINFPTSPTFNWVKSYVVQDRGQRSRLAERRSSSHS